MSRRSGSSHGLGMYWLRPARLIASTTASRPAWPVSRIFTVLRAAPVDLLEQLDALHARHDLIGDHHRELLAVVLQIVDQLERLARVLGDRDVALVAEARRQLLAQRREDALLVVDAEDVLAHRGESTARVRRGEPAAEPPRRDADPARMLERALDGNAHLEAGAARLTLRLGSCPRASPRSGERC